MSKTTFDNILKSAMWNAYNNKCFYCTKPLEWTDLHIDHIIPESFANELEEFQRVKHQYELDEDFDLHGLYNLVPTHAKCNLRKGDEVFPKTATLYYLSLTNSSKDKVETEMAKLKNRKNKGLILSKLQSALDTNLINLRELEVILFNAKQKNWNNVEITLPDGLEFIDEVYNSFYLDADWSILYEKKISLGGEFDGLYLGNGKDQTVIVSSLREWQSAIQKGFYPSDTISIKFSESFTFLEDFLEALHKAQMPKVSFISEPWIEINQLQYLSPSILHDFEGRLNQFSGSNISIMNLVEEGVIILRGKDVNKVYLEFEGIETSFVEQFRADFNNDGIEDIFVRGWTRAIGGTLGFGFTTILTRYSERHLIQEVTKSYRSMQS